MINQMLNVIATNLHTQNQHGPPTDTPGKNSHEHVSQQTGDERQSPPGQVVPPDERDRVPVPPGRDRKCANYGRGQVRRRRGGRLWPTMGDSFRGVRVVQGREETVLRAELLAL